LDDSSSELNRGGFGLSLLFFADGVTVVFFDADGSCCLLVVAMSLLLITLCPFSERMVMDLMYLTCLVSKSGNVWRPSACARSIDLMGVF
jgi:hypothetical protein